MGRKKAAWGGKDDRRWNKSRQVVIDDSILEVKVFRDRAGHWTVECMLSAKGYVRVAKAEFLEQSGAEFYGRDCRQRHLCGLDPLAGMDLQQTWTKDGAGRPGEPKAGRPGYRERTGLEAWDDERNGRMDCGEEPVTIN